MIVDRDLQKIFSVITYANPNYFDLDQNNSDWHIWFNTENLLQIII